MEVLCSVDLPFELSHGAARDQRTEQVFWIRHERNCICWAYLFFPYKEPKTTDSSLVIQPVSFSHIVRSLLRLSYLLQPLFSKTHAVVLEVPSWDVTP